MNPPSESITCDRCGAALPAIGGQCPACLAQEFLSFMEPAAAVSDLPEIPGWRVTGVLGAGGMGRVYRAENESDGAPAAVKVMESRWSQNPVMAARFEQEAETLRRLEHPGIVRLLDTAETSDGDLCIIMEYVEGCDLGRLLRAERLSPERAADIFFQVCAAVEHAHGRGFIHRDIKPSNMLTSSDATVKLADFGLAREETHGDSAIGGLTATTDQFGTAYYLAPERMIPGNKATAAGDVYSLGVLLYHLFTGRMPLGKFAPLSSLSGLPVTVDALISGALESEPARRTTSVEELRTGFEKVWRTYLAGASRRRLFRRSAMAAAVLALTGGALAAGILWQRHVTPPPAVAGFVPPERATGASPWTNSLGMQFVPVPGTSVLFSVWETRKADIKPFITAVKAGFEAPWLEDFSETRRRAFRQSIADSAESFFGPDGTLDLDSRPADPVALMYPMDAWRFCKWLTWVDQAQGRLAPHQHYRLPLRDEWLLAAGGAEEALRPGNLAGSESTGQKWLTGGTLPERDDFPGPAPAGSFPAELFGLFDMSGNAAEWVQLRPAVGGSFPKGSFRIAGPSFADGNKEHLSFGHTRMMTGQREVWTGFRIVLDYQNPAQPEP